MVYFGLHLIELVVCFNSLKRYFFWNIITINFKKKNKKQSAFFSLASENNLTSTFPIFVQIIPFSFAHSMKQLPVQNTCSYNSENKAKHVWPKHKTDLIVRLWICVPQIILDVFSNSLWRCTTTHEYSLPLFI